MGSPGFRSAYHDRRAGRNASARLYQRFPGELRLKHGNGSGHVEGNAGFTRERTIATTHLAFLTSSSRTGNVAAVALTHRRHWSRVLLNIS
ncbi:hypothetical protein GCM10022380_76280 [Amycolatopsis tucumanensis]|uniref:Uncharacterized protein n=1 Tax=Amycolatopsis tucumanensis TaxID=401106 RepID=A0ABP7JK90_9PSEU